MIPVIICSADARSLREKRERLGEKRCTVPAKPFELEELPAKVQEALSPTLLAIRADDAPELPG